MAAGREGTLCVLACHGVYDPEVDQFYAEHPQDRAIYQAQLFYALRHLSWRESSPRLLLISGGMTKKQRRCTEGQSYLDWARVLGWVVPANVALEEHALTSIENLLLSLYRYRQLRGVYPENIEVISWGFKKERFEATLDALNRWQRLGERWAEMQFFPVGDLFGPDREIILRKEREYCVDLQNGIEAYYGNEATQAMIRRRDAFGCRQEVREAYSEYPLPF